VAGADANWPADTGVADTRAPTDAKAEALGEVGTTERSPGASAGSGGGGGLAGIHGEHTIAAAKRVLRERIDKVPLDRFSVSL
jgi:hypothetical protein